MQSVKNIIFDLGGVLLNLDMKRTLGAYQEMGLLYIEELFRIGHASSFFKQYEIGAIDDEEFLSSIQKLEGNRGSREQVLNAWNAMLLDFPKERVDWLKSLRNKYRLFLFSNTNALHLQYFQQSFYEAHGFAMDELFEKAYYSHLVGLRKPDAAAYQLVLSENDLLPGETVFIDDALVNVEAANNVGIRGIHLADGIDIFSLI